MSTVVNKLIFSYIVKKGQVTTRDRSFLALKDISSIPNLPTHNVKGNILPITMNPKEYGQVVREGQTLEGNPLFTVLGSNKQIYDLEVLSNGHVIRGHIVGGISSKAQFSWEDIKQENGFIRTVGLRVKWHFTNDGKILSYKNIPCKPFIVANKDKKIVNKFFFFDIETTFSIKDGIKNVIPYLLCAYNGAEYFSSYLDSFSNETSKLNKSIDRIFSDFIKKLLTWAEKSTSIHVFAHNFSGFFRRRDPIVKTFITLRRNKTNLS